MTLEWLEHILPGVIRLIVAVTLGIYLGTLLEATPLARWAGWLARPFMHWGRLPSVCATAFVTSFISPRTANTLLAGSHSSGQLSRRHMILGALANTFPASFVHIRTTLFILIPLLGAAGAGYILFQIASGLTGALLALTAARLWREPAAPPDAPLYVPSEPSPLRAVLRLSWQRSRPILTRVLLLTVPLYALVAWADAHGFFERLTEWLPTPLARILPASSLSIIVAHMTNVLTATSIASELLHSGRLTGGQVFLTLVLGYGLTIPLRTLRHTLPSYVGIFPGRDGVWLVMVSQGFRIVFTALVAGITGCVLMTGL